MTVEPFAAVVDQFKPQGKVISIRPYGKGNVNDTFLVTLVCRNDKNFILQRINTRIFQQPELVMQNIRTFSEYVRSQQEHISLSPGRRWEVPRVLLTKNGSDHWIGPDGSFWRAISFIEQAQSFETIQNIGHAQEVGYALAMFHLLIKDLPIEALADTLEGFHVTPRYLRHYDEVLAKTGPSKSPEVDYARQFINRQRTLVDVLEKAKEQGKLHLRPIHGDPKVNNVLIDITTRQAVSLIDLDTVKPGLIHYDIGDCLRSCCNPLGEDTEQWERVRFELDFCRAILKGYLSIVGGFLTETDYEYLFDAIRLIAFELGLRFFTDYLERDIYFKVGHKEQNLTRAMVQFKLTESIESQAADIRAVIRELK
ncbi:MAG: phosphotransferase [Deltaproteobacteria bacterium]|nr:phosphotransferase [Deltaproteobacteria bacterium]